MQFPVALISYSKGYQFPPLFAHIFGIELKRCPEHIEGREKCFFSASVGTSYSERDLSQPQEPRACFILGKRLDYPTAPWEEGEEEALGSAQDLSLGRIKGCFPTTWQTLADGVPHFFWFPCHERRPAAFVYIETFGMGRSGVAGALPRGRAECLPAATLS